MNVFDAIVNRRSIRSYTGEPPTAEEMDKILAAGHCAPIASAMYDTNHLTIITDKALLAEIEKAFGDYVGKPDLHPLYNAPVFVLVSEKMESQRATWEDWLNVVCSDAAIIVQNMALEAVELGVGTCHIWGAVRGINAAPDLLAKLGIPEGFKPVCGVILGKTDQAYEPREVRRDRFTCNAIG